MSPNIKRSTQASAERELYLLKEALDEHAIVAITDPAGVITYVNDKFCDISGYSRDELLGQTHRIINSGEHEKAFFVDMWRTISQGSTWRAEVCNRAKDGRLYWVDTTIVPFKAEDGSITQHVAIRADITDRKNIEQELVRANRELEEFVYTVSHDLKSPLVTIQGFAGLAKQSAGNGDEAVTLDCLSRVSEAVDRMRANIDDLLELSRVGQVSLRCESHDLRTLVSEVIAEHQIQIEGEQAIVDVGPDLGQLWCDRPRIKQVLANLLSNALLHSRSEQEPIRITIAAEQAQGEVVLRVADHGKGIKPEFRERSFKLFQRLESQSSGTGVGLAIIKRIAEMHAGRVWIEQTPGGGATFKVALPTQRSQRAASR